MDRLKAAKVFIDVTYTKNFTVTAKRLMMSRPMVTRYIEAMEDWLQVRLLHRTTRKISLTSAGEYCLKDIESWVSQAENLSKLIATDNELSDNIRISSSVSFSFSQLITPVISFMKLHPKVKIDIDIQDTEVDLIEQRIDLAIRISTNPNPSLIGKPIANNETILVASPEYLKSNSPITKPADLSKHACLSHQNFERNVWHLSKNDEHESVDLNCSLVANESTTLLYAAIQHAGISHQPSFLANKYINQGKLSHVLPDWKPEDMKVYALYSSRKYLSPTVRALIDYLATYFQNNKW